MRSIYQEADRVLIWLGDYFEPSDRRITLGTIDCGRLNHTDLVVQLHLQTTYRLLLILSDIDPTKKSQRPDLEESLASSNIQHWVILARLFYRSWFERLWVIQEVAASKPMATWAAWGATLIPWCTIERAARYILRPGSVLPPPHISRLFPSIGAHQVTQVALSSMLNVDTNNILTILHNTQGAICTDPRDRLYAILGIVDSTEASDVEIDYSLPVQGVYCKWARKRVQRVGGLDILNACADSSRLGDLPSWVSRILREHHP